MPSVRKIGCLTAACSFRVGHAFSFLSPSFRIFSNPIGRRGSGALTSKHFAVKKTDVDANVYGPPNKLLGVSSLRHDFFALRHGQSLANVAQLIQSNPAIACHEYGLSETGFAQARAAGADVVARFQANERWNRILLLTSDLKRALETAQTVRTAALDADIPVEMHVEERFRERWFGNWDGTSDENYHQVWKDDVHDADHTIEGVESVHSVTARATEAVLEWDGKEESLEDAPNSSSSSSMVICVAHGDVLQMLQTAFLKQSGTTHREVEHLETAQLRALELPGADG